MAECPRCKHPAHRFAFSHKVHAGTRYRMFSREEIYWPCVYTHRSELQPTEVLGTCGAPHCAGQITRTVVQRGVDVGNGVVTDVVDYTCNVCGDRGLKYPIRFLWDEVVHHAVNPRDVRPICGKVASNMRLRVSVNPYDVTCPDCIAKFLPCEVPK